jgi:hypothetical protein
LQTNPLIRPRDECIASASSLAVADTRIHKRRAEQASRSRAVVIKRVRRCIVLAAPRAGCNAIPPGVAVGDCKAGQLAGYLYGGVRRDTRALIASCVRIVRPSVRHTTSSLTPCWRCRRRRRTFGRGWYWRNGLQRCWSFRCRRDRRGRRWGRLLISNT